MSDGGKGSAPRPFSVSQDDYAKRWDAIFQRDIPKEDNTGTNKDSYQDVLSTEECLERDDKITKYNEETQQVMKNNAGIIQR